MSTTSKSTRRMLRVAYRTAQGALPPYSHRCSPKKFAQHSACGGCACLVLMRFFRTDYRGIAAILANCPELCSEIGLLKVPHFTCLQKAHDRLMRARRAGRLPRQTVDNAIAAGTMTRRVELAAADATGFEAAQTSHHFTRRRNGWANHADAPGPRPPCSPTVAAISSSRCTPSGARGRTIRTSSAC